VWLQSEETVPAGRTLSRCFMLHAQKFKPQTPGGALKLEGEWSIPVTFKIRSSTKTGEQTSDIDFTLPDALTGWVNRSGGTLRLTPPIQFGEENRIGLISSSLVEVMPDGTLRSVDSAPLSMPSPTVEIQELTPSSVRIVERDDLQELRLDLHIEGTIDDALADITPTGAAATVENAFVIVNGGAPDPLGIVPDKKTNAAVSHKQFDFTGTFTAPLQDFVVTEGLNTVRIEATNALGQVGYALYTFTVEPSDQDDQVRTTAIAFAAQPSPSQIDTVTASTVLSPSGRVIDSYTLTETGPNTKVFRVAPPTGGILALALISAPETWNSGLRDYINYTLTQGSAQPATYTAQETTGNSLRFSTSQPTPVAAHLLRHRTGVGRILQTRALSSRDVAPGQSRLRKSRHQCRIPASRETGRNSGSTGPLHLNPSPIPTLSPLGAAQQ